MTCRVRRRIVLPVLVIASCFDPTTPDATGDTTGDTTGDATGTSAAPESTEPGSTGGPGSSGADESSGGCDPNAAPKDAPCLVDDAYGVFVAPDGLDLYCKAPRTCRG